MALKVPNVGEGVMLANVVNKTIAQNLKLRLYSAPSVEPGETAVAADFTELVGNGYPAGGIELTGASWAITEGDPSFALYAKQTFTFTGAAGNVYGYYMTQVASGKLVYFEEFTGAPYNVVNNGDKIEVTPKIELA